MNAIENIPHVAISSVVAGEHAEDTVVTVTGVLNAPRTRKSKQGNEWASFLLIDDKTAVDVDLWPAVYAEFRDLLGPVTVPDEHPFTSLRPPTLTLTGRVRAPGFPDCRPTVHVTDVRCDDHDQHAPHPPLPPLFPARIALSHLTWAARNLREAATTDTATPVGELVKGVKEALGEVWATFADHDGNALYERNQQMLKADPASAIRVDAEADDLAANLEPIVGDGKPSLPAPDGSGRAATRSRYRVFGWPYPMGARPS